MTQYVIKPVHISPTGGDMIVYRAFRVGWFGTASWFVCSEKTGEECERKLREIIACERASGRVVTV